MNHPTPAIKFRPSLTLSEIQFILSLIPPTSNPELRRKLEVFTLKAEHGITKPAHVVAGVKSLEESLGFTSSASSANAKMMYEIWLKYPNSLTPQQLADVQDYRFMNSLMSEEESAEYETKLLTPKE